MIDTLHDTVYDAMHNIALNVINQQLHYFADQDLLTAEVEKCLQHVPWTAGMFSYNICYLLDIEIFLILLI